MSRLHAALTSCIVSTFQYEALLKIIFLCRLRLNTLLLLIRIHFTFRSAAVLDPRGHLAPPLLHPLLIHSVKCYSSSAPPVSQFQKSQLLLFFFLQTEIQGNQLSKLRLTCEGTFFGGSIRIEGSHSPGGRTVTWSRNSSIPAIRSLRSLAL